jgi:hypothetical protein
VSRSVLLTAAALFALDLGTTVTAPATGLSLTGAAQAADFTGRIKRIRIRKKRVGSSYKVQAKVQDGGDATAADAAELAVQVCVGTTCTTALELDQDEYTGILQTGIYSYDGAVTPVGSFTLESQLLDANGKQTGLTQTWTVKGDGKELTAVADKEVTEGTYISELTFTTDACGNGRIEAEVAGKEASEVHGHEWTSLDGTGFFSADTVELCGGLPCVTGGLSEGRTSYTTSKADLGTLGEKLAATPEAAVTVVVTAYDEKGGVLGTTKTEATAKYGDILIDGVPLEFD